VVKGPRPPGRRPFAAGRAATAPAPGAPFDFRRNLAPIYIQLVTIFRRFVVTGQWPVGSQIPRIDDLAARFGVARATVRHAFDLLEREGLVSRHRRHGTFVSARPVPHELHDTPTEWSRLVRAKDGMAIECLDRRAGVAAPEPYHPGPGGLAPRYDRYSKLYRLGGVPLLVENAHIDSRLCRRVGAKRFAAEPTLRLLDGEATLRIGRADQTMLVGVADGEVARILGVPQHAPAAIARYTIRDADGVLVCESEEVLRGDLARVTERLAV
jgi:GntR family transcriptional regulator